MIHPDSAMLLTLSILFVALSEASQFGDQSAWNPVAPQNRASPFFSLSVGRNGPNQTGPGISANLNRPRFPFGNRSSGGSPGFSAQLNLPRFGSRPSYSNRPGHGDQPSYGNFPSQPMDPYQMGNNIQPSRPPSSPSLQPELNPRKGFLDFEDELPSDQDLALQAPPLTLGKPQTCNNSPVFGMMGGNEPPERHVAWLEYLANVYIESDQLGFSKKLSNLLYRQLLENPRLRRPISQALKGIQRRIDDKNECRMKKCNSKDCNYPYRRTSSRRNLLSKALSGIMQGRMRSPLNRRQRYLLNRIYGLLAKGLISPALQLHQHLLRGFPRASRNDQVKRLGFVLKLIRFDVENPTCSMPLWVDSCRLDWKKKNRILDAFDMLRSNGTLDRKLSPETRARILIAAQLGEGWLYLGYLPRADRYLARASLLLNNVPRPGYFGDGRPSTSPMEARDMSRILYQRCISDRHLSQVDTFRCREGLRQVDSLQQACPYGGFIRIGLFPQIFGNYLFVKCREQAAPSPSTFLPPKMPEESIIDGRNPNNRGPSRFGPTQGQSPGANPYANNASLPNQPKRDVDKQPFSNPNGHGRKRKHCHRRPPINRLRRIAGLLDGLRREIGNLEPVQCEMQRRGHYERPGRHNGSKKWFNARQRMDTSLEEWARGLRNHLDSLLEGDYDRERRNIRKRKGLLRRLKGALKDIANIA